MLDKDVNTSELVHIVLAFIVVSVKRLAVGDTPLSDPGELEKYNTKHA